MARVEDPDKVWRRIEKASHNGLAKCPKCGEGMALAQGEGWARRYTCSICDTRFSLLWPTPMSEASVEVFATMPEWMDALSRSVCFGPRKMRPVSPGRNRPRADAIRAVADEMVAGQPALVRAVFALRRLPDARDILPRTRGFEEAGVFVLPQAG